MPSQRLRLVYPETRTESHCDIRVGEGIWSGLATDLAGLTGSRRAAIITDQTVGRLYLAKVQAGLAAAGWDLIELLVPGGENANCADARQPEQLTAVWRALAQAGIGRQDLMIALGGRSVGDLAAFAADSWQGGIGCVQLPTTLSAMADPIITRPAHLLIPEGERLVGIYHHPLFMSCDLQVLGSLTDRQWRSGLLQITKAALVSGPEDWRWLASRLGSLLAHDSAACQEAIVRAVSSALRLSAEDLQSSSSDSRLLLDFGLDFADALRALSGYTLDRAATLAEGLRFAARLAVEAVGAPVALADDIDALLAAIGYPGLEIADCQGIDADTLFDRLTNGWQPGQPRQGLPMVLAKAPGQLELCQVDADLVKIYLIYWEQARRQEA